MPRLARASGDSRVSSWPLNVIDPERGVSRPMMLFNSVVLPTPLRPRRQTTCPGGTCRCTSHSTWLSPYDTFRPSTVSIDVMPSAQIDLDDARDALRCLSHKLHVVLHDQHRMVLRQPLQELPGLLAFVFGHTRNRFIQEKER